jgi:hypothetical protein
MLEVGKPGFQVRFSISWLFFLLVDYSIFSLLISIYGGNKL